MNNPELEILRNEMEYLYASLHRILVISPYDKAYEIASAACAAYQINRKNERIYAHNQKLEEELEYQKSQTTKRIMGLGRAR